MYSSDMLCVNLEFLIFGSISALSVREMEYFYRISYSVVMGLKWSGLLRWSISLLGNGDIYISLIGPVE